MNLGDITFHARASLDELAGDQFSDNNIRAWANAAIRDISAKSGCIEEMQLVITPNTGRAVKFRGDTVYAVELLGSLSAGVTWKDTNYTAWIDTPETIWIDKSDIISEDTVTSLMRITPLHLGHISLMGKTHPQYWFQWGERIYIEPVFDTNYVLRIYARRVATELMLSNNDEPVIPEEFQEAIIPFISFMAYLNSRRYGDAYMKYTEYSSMVQGLIDNYRAKTSVLYREIVVPDEVQFK